MVATETIRTTPVALSGNAGTVLERRYLLRDRDGTVIETPEQLFARVASAIAQAEPDNASRQLWAQRFYDEMAALRFLPNSPTLMNAGTGQGTLAACFVLPVDDSLESIMATAEAAAMVQKFGGGTGFSFSRLRGVGEPIASTHGAACGPVSVLRHYDDVSRLVTQGGKRDGANMGILRVDHPDIEQFIHAKDDGITAQRFNLSVGITDDFLAAAERGETFTLRDPRDGSPRGSIDAAALLDQIARAAWATGDPGLVFLDEINRHNPTPALGEIEATNPCGEVPLLPWEACTLGSINVGRFWDAERDDLDWDALDETVRLAVRFLDNVVEVNTFPVAEIGEAVRGNRKIGLGMMGWADLLIDAGIPMPATRRSSWQDASRPRSAKPPMTRPLPSAIRRAPSRTGSNRSTRTARNTATPPVPASPPPARSRSSPAHRPASSPCSPSPTTAAWATARSSRRSPRPSGPRPPQRATPRTS